MAYLVNYAINEYTAGAKEISLSTGWWWKTMISENWRGMLGAETFPALLFFIMLFFIPESPRWLVLKAKDFKAQNIFSRIYGNEEAKTQIADLKNLVLSEKETDWKILFLPGFRIALFIGVSLAILGQFMGVNAVLYYGPSIFQQTGLSEGDSLFYQVIVGAVNFGSTILAMAVIDKIGRKKLVYYGVSGMFITLILIAVYFTLNKIGKYCSAGNFACAHSVIHIFVCHFNLRCHLGVAFRNVPGKSAWPGHVGSRIFVVDWDVSYWAAHSLVDDYPFFRRSISVICSNVPALFVYRLETCSRNYRGFTGGH